MLGKNKKIANIEIQDYVIRYAEIKSSNPLVLTQCKEHYIPSGVIENGQIINDEAFAKVLKQCMEKWQLKNKQIRFIVPDSSVIIRTVDVSPEIADDELTGHIYFELGHSIHLPFDNPIVEAVSLGVQEGVKKVLIVASSEETVDMYYDYFKDENTDPVVADVSSLCQYRLFHHFKKTNEEDIFMLAQFNVKSVTNSIFEQHKPVFMQEVDVSYPEDTWKVTPVNQDEPLTREHFDSEKVHAAFEEIYTEMERLRRFYQYSLHNGDQEVTRILLTGDHPYLEDLFHEVKDRLNIPIDILSPEDVQGSKDMKMGSSFYNVIGLALKEGM
ncbi:hypothetical protein GCM10008986_26870 [Salinibacillus aidingensis]|uniref:Type IV pilus assembly protein PilM n=1 Tax=Salinibacillus aidingensis TaxID=237684 RepID=A0ABN1BIF8_9BACI